MGRKAGVAAEETRMALLDAAAGVFARSGYDGASIAEITAEAGLTSGAVYSHYASKAELFAAVVEARMDRDLDALLGDIDVADGLAAIGGTLGQRQDAEESLLVAAIVAARNDPDVARLLSAQIAERERLFKILVAEGQEFGVLRQGMSAAAIARFSLVVSLGSLVVGALDLGAVDDAEWMDLVEKLTPAFRS